MVGVVAAALGGQREAWLAEDTARILLSDVVLRKPWRVGSLTHLST